MRASPVCPAARIAVSSVNLGPVQTSFGSLRRLGTIYTTRGSRVQNTLIRLAHRGPSSDCSCGTIVTAVGRTLPRTPIIASSGCTTLGISTINYRTNTSLSAFSYFGVLNPRNINIIINGGRLIRHVCGVRCSNNDRIRNRRTVSTLHNLVCTPISLTVRDRIGRRLIHHLGTNRVPNIGRTFLTGTRDGILLIRFRGSVTRGILTTTPRFNTTPRPINDRDGCRFTPVVCHIDKAFHTRSPAVRRQVVHVGPVHDNPSAVVHVLHRYVRRMRGS